MKLVMTLVALLAVAGPTYAQVYGMCQLAKEMIKNGVALKTVPDWLCLAKAVSQMDSSKVTGPLTDGSYAYGIFQIQSNDWCKKGTPGNTCGVKCEDLVNGAIALSIKCSQQIYSQKGFQYWPGWVQSCKGKPLPDIHGC